MKIGIVGAENTHSAAIAQMLNKEMLFGRARVTQLWGETRALAREVAARTDIPRCVRRPEEMIGGVDGVVIAHRHAKYHIPAALPFIEAGIPVFVDKPFSITVREGRALLRRAETLGVPVTSFSVLPEQSSFRDALCKPLRSAGEVRWVQSSGPCDVRSPWGGLFFYGVHQVETLLKALGPGIEWAQVHRAGRSNPHAVAVLGYRRGGPIVTLAMLAPSPRAEFRIQAMGEKAFVDWTLRLDPSPYRAGMRKVLRMFRDGTKPYSAEQILEPIAVLEAMHRSFKSGVRERVRPI